MFLILLCIKVFKKHIFGFASKILFLINKFYYTYFAKSIVLFYR